MGCKQDIMIVSENINAKYYPNEKSKGLLIEDNEKLNEFIIKDEKNSHIFLDA